MQEKRFADDVKQKVMTEQQIEDVKRQEAKQRMMLYNKDLNSQIEESRMKKRYDNTLMTEHERMVNDKDIKAYM